MNKVLSEWRARDSLVLGVLSVLFLSGTVIMVEGWSSLRYLFLAGGTAIAFPLILRVGSIKKERSWSAVPLALLFAVALLAAGANQSGELLLLVLGLLVIWELLVRMLPSVVGGDRLLTLVVLAALLSHLPLVLPTLFAVNGLSLPSRGIFYNPNSFGTVVASLYATVLPLFVLSIKRRSRRWPLVSALAVLLGLLLLATAASASRTSFLAVGIVTLTLILLVGRQAYRKGRIQLQGIRMFVRVFAGLVTVVLVAYLWLPLEQIVDTYIVGKFQRKMGDPTGGRIDVWLHTIENASWLGKGREFFFTTDLGAHNTFISILGQYGWVSAAAYMALWCGILYKSVHYAMRQRRRTLYQLLPLSITVCFLALSMGEGMNGKLAMLMAFACVGAMETSTPAPSPTKVNYLPTVQQ